MTAIIVVGAQWGDEGKGKIVDLLAENADMVVRYGGGANAGHTLKVNGQKIVTHLLPSGVLHPRATCVLASGMVIDLAILLAEVRELEARGLSVRERMVLSPRAHVTLPFQAAIDRAANAGPQSIGTTGRGIGPTYSDKAARIGARVGDLLDPTRCERVLEQLIEPWRTRARAIGATLPTAEEAMAYITPIADELRPMLGDASIAVDRALKRNDRVVFEGAQGTLLDLDHGTYPFVTSSNTVAGGACTGVGVGPTQIHRVVGITKAYCTRVGHGPFPTELVGSAGDSLREAGEEYGATTGRPRRCGWLDLPALRYVARVNGLTDLVVTKLDILTGYKLIPVCVGYTVHGEFTEEFPIDSLDEASPVYEDFAGWTEDLTGARTMADLPETAQDYLRMIEARVGVPIAMVSVGADRAQTVACHDVFAGRS
ncbi:MAG: adenylosuccinate synthase [Deltaproteobacteria bacterium]|nr:adenylosuccinate synthase [Deltaproteobacteria bacterium]